MNYTRRIFSVWSARGSVAALTVLSIAGLPQLARAQVFLIDHGGQSIHTPTLGGTWNTPSSPTYNPELGVPYALRDATGAASAVTLTYSAGFEPFPLSLPGWSFGDKEWVAGAATEDFAISEAGVKTSITFGGLTPNQSYRLDHLAAGIGSSSDTNRVADYTIFGNFADSTPNGDDFHATRDGFFGGNILTWDDVAANSAGQIVLEATPVNQSQFGYFTATRLTTKNAVPEPGTLALLALGIIGGAFRYRLPSGARP